MAPSEFKAHPLDSNAPNDLPVVLLLGPFSLSGSGAVRVVRVAAVPTHSWVCNGEVESHVRKARMAPNIQINSGLSETRSGKHRNHDFPLASQASRCTCCVENAAHSTVEGDAGTADEAIKSMLPVGVKWAEASAPCRLVGLSCSAMLTQAWVA